MARTFNLDCGCHCGLTSQPVKPPGMDDPAYDFRAGKTSPKQVPICNRNSCRHSTSQLCTSYYPIVPPKLGKTKGYPSVNVLDAEPNCRRYFCLRCGCHLFRSILDKERQNWSDVFQGLQSGTPSDTVAVDESV